MEWDNTYQDSMHVIHEGHFGSDQNISENDAALTNREATFGAASYNIQKWQLAVSLLLLGMLMYLNFFKDEK